MWKGVRVCVEKYAEYLRLSLSLSQFRLSFFVCLLLCLFVFLFLCLCLSLFFCFYLSPFVSFGVSPIAFCSLSVSSILCLCPHPPTPPTPLSLSLGLSASLTIEQSNWCINKQTYKMNALNMKQETSRHNTAAMFKEQTNKTRVAYSTHPVSMLTSSEAFGVDVSHPNVMFKIGRSVSIPQGP